METGTMVIQMRVLLAGSIALCACSAQVTLSGDPDTVTPDSSQLDPDSTVATDTAPRCGKVLFLQFEGQALTQGASDATQNKASWMTIASGTAPAYHAGSGTRAADIQAIVDGITARLASFPITVVTTRPASGSYNMIVFGGAPANVGSRFSGAVQQLDCNDQTVNDVAWISDSVSPTTRIVNFAIGAVGFGVGLTATSDPNDCMCGWDNGCAQTQNACTLTAGITRDPAANQTCAGAGATQDEPAAFNASFCQ